MEQRIVFTGKNELHVEPFTPAACEPGMLRLRTRVSLISTGTEGIVLNRLFDPGTHWDAWVRYPFFPGYAVVSTVEEVGAGVTGFAVGDRVVARQSHASVTLVKATECAKVPDGLSDEDASWFALAKIAWTGWRAADIRLGDDIVIIGGGPVGQMLARWAFSSGARTIVMVDPVASRLELAQKACGAIGIDKPIDQAGAAVVEALGGKAPSLVADSTGNAQVFVHALKLAAPQARILILGDTGTPTQQHLTADVIRKELRIVAAHDTHQDAVWSPEQIYALFFTLVSTDRFRVSGMVTHTFAPNQARAAYDLLNARRQETMGILFDWRT